MFKSKNYRRNGVAQSQRSAEEREHLIDGNHLWEGSQFSIEFFVDQGWEHFADLTWDHLSDHAGDLGLKIDFWRE